MRETAAPRCKNAARHAVCAISDGCRKNLNAAMSQNRHMSFATYAGCAKITPWGAKVIRTMSDPVEPFAIADFFCTDVAVEDLGSGVRGLVFSTPRGIGSEAHQQNQVRVIIPAACLLSIRQKLMPHADAVLYELIGQTSNNYTSSQ